LQDTLKNLDCNIFGQAAKQPVSYLLAKKRGFFSHSIKREI